MINKLHPHDPVNKHGTSAEGKLRIGYSFNKPLEITENCEPIGKGMPAAVLAPILRRNCFVVSGD